MCWEGEEDERGFDDVRDLGEVEGDSIVVSKKSIQ